MRIVSKLKITVADFFEFVVVGMKKVKRGLCCGKNVFGNFNSLYCLLYGQSNMEHGTLKKGRLGGGGWRKNLMTASRWYTGTRDGILVHPYY